MVSGDVRCIVFELTYVKIVFEIQRRPKFRWYIYKRSQTFHASSYVVVEKLGRMVQATYLAVYPYIAIGYNYL